MSTPTPPWAETHAPFTCEAAKRKWVHKQRYDAYAASYPNAKNEKNLNRYQDAQHVQWMHDTLMELADEAIPLPAGTLFPDGILQSIEAYAAYHNAQKP
jgi:hypothetical protein